MLAIKSGVAVVPVTICDSWRIMKKGEVTVHPGTVKVHVERPISVHELQEDFATELAKEVREIVARHYEARPGEPVF